MRKIEYIVPEEYDARKVVHFLRGSVGCSATLIKVLKSIPDGMLLNGQHTRTIDILKTGDCLCINVGETHAPKSAAICTTEVQTLYEDDDIIVFNKPVDMPCHQAKRHQEDTLANVFAALCAKRAEAMTFRAVNRMDRNTTGAVVVAKNAFAAAMLAGKMEKTYLAVVNGVPSPMQGGIEAPIARQDLNDIRRVVREDGQYALTRYRTIKTDGVRSMLSCTLPTGRTHQIRVHMAYIGCPLLGDDLYGQASQEISRQALHCAEVSFIHPVSGKNMILNAPLAKDMQKLFYSDCEK